MRRLTAAVVGVCLVAPAIAVATLTGPVLAQPTPTGSPGVDDSTGIEVPEPIPGEPQCEVTDPRLVEISGLIAIDDGYLVVNDQTDFDDRLPIFFLDHGCQVVDQIFFGSRPYDPEDLALDRERDILWVGDVGDNGAVTSDVQTRPTVALWRVDLAGDRTPVIHRFGYPDGPRDAEAIVLDGDGLPIIVTKDLAGQSELYRPAAELVPNNPHELATPLELVGEFEVPDTGSEHLFLPSVAARRVVTGGANSPDGTRVVLRTYTDAFEFDVVDGDVAGAITDGTPRVTPLPDEPWGEAISYSPDGERFLTVSEVPEQRPDLAPVILAYTPTAPVVAEPTPTTAAEEPAGGGSGGSLFSNVRDILNLVAVVGVLGVLLVAAGVFGIVRARRRARDADRVSEETGRVTGRARITGEPAGSAASAGPAAPAPEPAAGVYASSAAQPAAEYGGGDYQGPEYRGQGRGYESPEADRYAGADGYAGAGYGADPEGGGYAPAGYAESTAYPGAEYGGGEYGGAEYQGAEYGGGEYQGGYRAAEYGGGEYPGAEYASGEYGGDYQRGGGYDPAGYGAAEYAGEEYGADPYAGVDGHGYAAGRYGYGDAGYGHPDQPADPGGWSGHHQRSGYAGSSGYPEGGYEDDGHAGGYGYPPGDGAYSGGHYQSGAPDHYSDDPDYPYEFRDQRR